VEVRDGMLGEEEEEWAEELEEELEAEMGEPGAGRDSTR
jgi:hypothetical protein